MTLKEQIIHEIEQVPDHLLEEFLDFILFTKIRRQTPSTADLNQSHSFNQPDPLADFIGAIHSGNLANAIDETLYE